MSKLVDIDSIKAEIKELEDAIANRKKLLSSICEVLGHDLRGDGHDSHYSYEKCYTCDRVEKA